MKSLLVVIVFLMVINQVILSTAKEVEIIGEKEGNNFLKRKLRIYKKHNSGLYEECCNEGCSNEEVYEVRSDMRASQAFCMKRSHGTKSAILDGKRM
ncbi:hypothetical protein AC249_AIPGENE2816 [Exaiptasia diaphana]|nr:hypothetical protein AC249_AIPGENE2816 [Exaiptasia diaphana]